MPVPHLRSALSVTHAPFEMIILIGHNDTPYLGSGWHPPQEGPAGLPCRWISQRAELTLPPVSLPLSRITVTVSAPATIRNQKPGLTLYTGETLLGHCPDLGQEGHWSTVIYPLSTQITSAAPLLLNLAVEHRINGTVTPLAFVPHEVLHNGDLRELGALVSSIRLG